MTVFFYYSILATIVALYYLFKTLFPVIYSGRQRVPEAPCMKHYIVTGVVFFCTCWVLAPFLMLTMFNKARIETFKRTVYDKLTLID